MTLVDWLDPRHIIEVGGVVLILVIIFAESGLFFGFFLPGDSLLFSTGLLCGTSMLDFNVYLLIILAFAASVLGYAVGYYTGFKLSESRIFREEQFLFRKSLMTKTDCFFKKHGLSAFVIARFIPLVRTYIPILAGTTRMNYGLFTRYNLIGAALWVSVLILIGYFLGKNYPQIIESLGWIVTCLILVTLLPLAQQLKYLRKDVAK